MSTSRKLATLTAAVLAVGVSGWALATQSTTVLKKKSGDHSFQVTVEPARPEVGRRVSLRLDLAQIPSIPDPTFGDQVPVRGATLVAVLTPDGASSGTKRYVVHDLGGAGAYGLHWTPHLSGVWKLTFERRGEKLPPVEFQVGVGVDTPVQDDGSGARRPVGAIFGGLQPASAAGRPGTTVRGPLTPVSAGPSAASVMDAFEGPSATVTEALRAEKIDAAALTEALAALKAEAARLAGTVPDRYRVGEGDYDRLAKQLDSELGAIHAAAVAGDTKKAADGWRQTLDGTCAQCHVKFWWALTPNLNDWPKVTAESGWKR